MSADVAGVPGAGASAVFDVRDRDASAQAIRGLVEALGGCDAVVANAGIVDTIHRAERFPDEEWRKDIETNLSASSTSCRRPSTRSRRAATAAWS